MDTATFFRSKYGLAVLAAIIGLPLTPWTYYYFSLNLNVLYGIGVYTLISGVLLAVRCLFSQQKLMRLNSWAASVGIVITFFTVLELARHAWQIGGSGFEIFFDSLPLPARIFGCAALFAAWVACLAGCAFGAVLIAATGSAPVFARDTDF